MKEPLLGSSRTTSRTSRFSYLLGAILMLIWVVECVVQQEVMKAIQSKGIADRASLITWCNHNGMFIVGLPASCLLHYRRTGSASFARMWEFFLEKQEWSGKGACGRALMLSLLYLVPSLAWVATCKFSSLTLVTAANRFDSVFVLAFTSLLTREAPRLAQVGFVLSCIVGVVFVAIGQQQQARHSMGNVGSAEVLSVFISPSMTAVYYMCFNKLTRRCTSPELICMMLGLIGLANMLLLWPVMPVCYAIGIDAQSLSDVLNARSIGAIVLTAALATVGNFSIMPALARTSPLFVAILSLMAVPITLVVDMVILRNTRANPWIICGALIVIAGFSASSLAEASGRDPVAGKQCASDDGPQHTRRYL